MKVDKCNHQTSPEYPYKCKWCGESIFHWSVEYSSSVMTLGATNLPPVNKGICSSCRKPETLNGGMMELCTCKKNPKLEERRKKMPTKEDIAASSIKEAKRIYGIFYMTCSEYSEEIRYSCHLQAKQCGYILCNNIIKLSEKRTTKDHVSLVDEAIIDYYKQVKQQIEKL